MSLMDDVPENDTMKKDVACDELYQISEVLFEKLSQRYTKTTLALFLSYGFFCQQVIRRGVSQAAISEEEKSLFDRLDAWVGMARMRNKNKRLDNYLKRLREPSTKKTRKRRRRR